MLDQSLFFKCLTSFKWSQTANRTWIPALTNAISPLKLSLICVFFMP